MIRLKQLSKEIIKHKIANVWPEYITPRILYYHSIAPEKTRSLDPSAFASQLDWLIEHGFKFMTFSAIAERVIKGELSRKSVCITFDDGYLDNYEYALPILVERKIPATFFIVSQMIDDIPKLSNQGNKLFVDYNMLTKLHLREMHQLGMEIGSHTRQHIHVRHFLEQSKQVAIEELAGSRKELENIIGDQVTTFAYPNGQKGVFNRFTGSLLLDTGYEFAATTIWGSLNKSCHPMEIPRIGINNPNESIITFAAKMMGRYDYIRYYHLAFDLSLKW